MRLWTDGGGSNRSSMFNNGAAKANLLLSKTLYKKEKRREWQDGSGVKAMGTKPENLSSIPRTHIVEGENQLWPIGL